MIEVLTAALADHGLLLRGGFRPAAEDLLPATPLGREPRFLALVGNAGPALWRRFSQSPEASDGASDPLNRWTRRVVAEIAGRFGAAPLFPFQGPPYYPFQRWALRSEAVSSSPLGILIHPRFGLWHAYRAALLFDEVLDEHPGWPIRTPAASPCETCQEKPCLKACPVGAFTGRDYRVADCARHVAGPDGGDCRDGFCKARAACPVGLDYIYDREQAAFHMAAFLAARTQ